MCGIIGYTGPRAAAPILIDGLASLEYRGYDSSGIGVMDPSGQPLVHKSSGKLSRLKAALENGLTEGTTGIGHTRWGDPRRADGLQRPPAHGLPRRGDGGPQRHRGELPGAEAGPDR